jgi:hypothetical protein
MDCRGRSETARSVADYHDSGRDRQAVGLFGPFFHQYPSIAAWLDATRHRGVGTRADLEAEKRGVTPRVLRERIITTVLHDRIIGAVLDDLRDDALDVKNKENADALS